MPSRNVVKIYVDNGWYHIYNRGVNKQNIFKDKEDYTALLGMLKKYLSAKVKVYNKESHITTEIDNPDKTWEKINLHAYCLMPNHYHMLIEQTEKEAMTKFLRRVMTAYSMYFNRKYNRVGTLFQGRYKATGIRDDGYLLHLSRYIHTNPLDLGLKKHELVNYEYSSYKNYLGLKNASWLKTKEILKFFSNEKVGDSYKHFVEDWKAPKDKETIPTAFLIDQE
jgi:putative transposase